MNDQVPCADERLAEYAKKLKAVGHPIRLRLLCLIAREEDPCVSDLWKCLKQPQPVISQHLAILKQNGIVSAEVQRTRRVYSIADDFIRDLVAGIVSDTEKKPS
ncbi:MAG TPA: metalloregulator ArsR/SmtB family transcription factor [Spirochaetales bacterium]|nr:metalloregulator ArsR/SmtB family transcription factor [Spirochaetales bacterium]